MIDKKKLMNAYSLIEDIKLARKDLESWQDAKDYFYLMVDGDDGEQDISIGEYLPFDDLKKIVIANINKKIKECQEKLDKIGFKESLVMEAGCIIKRIEQCDNDLNSWEKSTKYDFRGKIRSECTDDTINEVQLSGYLSFDCLKQSTMNNIQIEISNLKEQLNSLIKK